MGLVLTTGKPGAGDMNLEDHAIRKHWMTECGQRGGQ